MAQSSDNLLEAEEEVEDHPFRKTMMKLVLHLEVEEEVVLEELDVAEAEEEISPI